ncbi:MAG: N-acetylmuramoyl-L-alanine amidase [Woeseiaceae bacterium]|nr:N-acetylmuramoyl-L-alanine amidase [Woeseiaceae bacterium]
MLVALVLAVSLSGCAGMKKIESANQNSRVSIIVIHFTTADFGDSLSILTQPSNRPVSSHYLIPEPNDPTYDRPELTTFQLVDELRRAWHAGTSYWAGKTGLNDQSIGIELVNRSWCHASEEWVDPESGVPDRLCFFPDFAEGQIDLLVELLDDILERHPNIKPTHIVAHSDIAPSRKIDPGPRFPWQRLATMGYGAWYDDATVIRYWEKFRDEPLPVSNVQQALGAYGYKIDVTGEHDEQSRDVMRAFQLHFRPWEVTSEISRESTATLFALLDKYYPETVEELLIIEEPVDADEPADSEPTDGETLPTAAQPEMAE